MEISYLKATGHRLQRDYTATFAFQPHWTQQLHTPCKRNMLPSRNVNYVDVSSPTCRRNHYCRKSFAPVGVDLFSFRGQDYCVTVDYLSNYFEIDRLNSKKVQDIVYILKQHFARHGIPSTIFTDNNPFLSQEFSKFAKLYEFEHRTHLRGIHRATEKPRMRSKRLRI